MGRISSGTVANMVLHLKSWLSMPDQINQLRIRGMEIPASDQASDALKIIGYYRLSGYWYLYREPHPTQKDQRLDDFLPGTQFAEILALYHFDSALKGLIWRGIESVEIAFRSRIGHLLGEAGPLTHSDPGNFRRTFDHDKWWGIAKGRINRARGHDAAVDHHYDNYGGDIPLWVLTDLLDFSDVSKLYAGMTSPGQREIADWFGVSMADGASKASRKSWNKHPPLANWLENLTTVRNICAHHGRLWNRQLIPLGIAPRVQHLPAFAEIAPTLKAARPETWQIERVYGTICIISQLLDHIEPRHTWRSEVDSLVASAFPTSGYRATSEMGFPHS